jgi:hypothetical protein
MNYTKFIDARFHQDDAADIEARLRDVLRKLKKTKLETSQKDATAEAEATELKFDEFEDDEILNLADERKLIRRADLVVKRRQANSGLTHLKSDEIKQLSVLKTGARLVPPKDEAWADELAAKLHGEMPWMGYATEAAWHALRRSARRGDAGLHLPPLVLNGPAGIGKSVWARKLAELCKVPSCLIEVGSGSTGWRVAGLERGWSTAAPGRPLETILQSGIANPIVIVDELCKMQDHTSSKGQRFSMANTLLALLEPATNQHWECPYFRVIFDMSHVSWVMTYNDVARVAVPLRNRCTVIELPALNMKELASFTQREVTRRGLSEQSAEAIVATLSHPISRQGYFSLRDVVRMIDRAEVLETKPRLH